MPWAPDYTTLPELKAWVGLADTVDDVIMATAITAASRAVDHETNRQFGKTAAAEARTYYARPDYERGYWVVDVDDFQTTSGLIVTVDGTAVTTFVKEPVNATQKGRPWTRIVFTDDSEVQPSTHPHEVDVIVPWGWTAIPVPVKQASLLQASRLLKRRHSPEGVAGFGEFGAVRVSTRPDPDVAVSLRDFKRLRMVG